MACHAATLLVDLLLLTLAAGAFAAVWFKPGSPLEPLRDRLAALRLAETGRFVRLRNKIGEAADCPVCLTYDAAVAAALLLLLAQAAATIWPAGFGWGPGAWRLLLAALAAGRLSLLLDKSAGTLPRRDGEV